MAENITTNLQFRKEVDIIVTTQARRILSQSKYTVEDFLEWTMKDRKFSLGGHDVSLFLEAMSGEK